MSNTRNSATYIRRPAIDCPPIGLAPRRIETDDLSLARVLADDDAARIVQAETNRLEECGDPWGETLHADDAAAIVERFAAGRGNKAYQRLIVRRVREILV